MVMLSGSLSPERDARMRATASAGDRRVEVSGPQFSQEHLYGVTQQLC